MAEGSASHFRPEQWLDYLRGTASADLRCQIDDHLQLEGCALCEGQLRYWSQALAGSRELAERTPPAAVLSRAKAIFQPLPAVRWAELPARLAAWVAPGGLAPAYGFRSPAMTAAHVLQSGATIIRLKPEASSTGEIVLLGTVSPQSPETPAAETVSVLLVSGKKILAQTRTTRFGEFLLEFSPARNLRLVLVEPEAATRVDVELDAILFPPGETLKEMP